MRKTIFRRLVALLPLLLLSSAALAYDDAVDHLLTGDIITSGTAANAQKAFDDNTTTYFSASSDKFQWVGLDLGEPCVITRVAYTPAPGYSGPDKCLLSLFEGANSPDFMDAMPLHLISKAPGRETRTTADVNVSRGFRYVRYVGGSGSYCQIAELQFYGHKGVGDDSRFYQITNLPTLSVHVQNNILPVNRGEDFPSRSVLIYEGGTIVQDYPVLFRVRGNFSSTPENKAYRIKFNDGKSHHMMKDSPVNESPTKAKKWVLINSYRDKTLMRNPVAWAMAARAEMDWTPWSQVVDLVVNGDYRGTYTLADAVSVNKGRINITEMTDWDLEDKYITGGYFVEVDNNASREPYWFSSGRGNPVTVHDPDEDIIQPEQFNYIRNAWNNMENIVFGPNYTDRQTGLRSVLDIDSFLKYFLVSEFNGNTDMLCQIFFYKERGDDHFYTGPVWDAELALDDDATVYPGNDRADWTYPVRQTGNFGQFVSRVLSDPSVMVRLQELWGQMRRGGRFDAEAVAADVDSLRRQLSESANLNFIRWPYLNQYISLTPAIRGSWDAEVDVVRNYVRDRVAWMDNKLSYGKVHQENGIYQISSALDLCTFSSMVNDAGEKTAKAVLTADIDMSEYNDLFKPIGTQKNQFSGSLDGKGHTIRNLVLHGTGNVGLFGEVAGSTFSNIIFDASCRAEGTDNVAMLIGYARTGVLEITGIENHADVTASGDHAAALVGNARLLATIDITACSNTANITAQSNAAALAAPAAGKMSVTDAYNCGTISGAAEGKEFAFADRSITLNNCWDIHSMQTRNMTAGQVRNGCLAFLMNTGKTTPVWRQNIDNGKTPDLWPVRDKTSGNVFFRNETYTNSDRDVTPYRYYNLLFTELQGGFTGTLQFSEIDVLDATLSDVPELSVYAGTKSSIANHDWPDAADNDTGTKYCSVFNGKAYFLLDAGKAVVPYGYRITSANDTQRFPGRNPASWKFYGSNVRLTDPYSNDWVLLDEKSGDATMGAENYTPYDFLMQSSAFRGNRYFQLAISGVQNGSVVQLSEFDLIDAQGNEVSPVSMYATTAEGFGGEAPDNLFDNDESTKFCGPFQSGHTLYIYIDAGKEVRLSGYRMVTANDTQNIPGRNPSAWTLLGSNVKSQQHDDTCWTLIDRRENDNTLGAVNFTPFFFPLDNSDTPLPTYKLGDVNGDGTVDRQDYEALRRHIVGLPVKTFSTEAADINRDGKVNAQDLMELIAILQNL